MFTGSFSSRVVCVFLLVFTLFPNQTWAADGDPDTSFSGDGLWTADLTGHPAWFLSAAVQDDGKIVAVGRTDTGGVDTDILVARFNADGTLDTTFSGDGWTTTDISGNDDKAQDVLIQDNGKIVVVGYTDKGGDKDIFVARYNTGGGLDTTFDGDGIQTRDFDSDDDSAYGVAIQDDGAILVCGSVTDSTSGSSIAAIARYTSDGAHDITFGNKALALVGISDIEGFVDVALLPDGRIAACGTSRTSATTSDVLLAVFTSDGEADVGFGTNGLVNTSLGKLNIAYSLVVRPDGKIVLGGGGNAVDDGDLKVFLARYQTSGELDPAFGDDGTIIHRFSNLPLGRINTLNLTADGKITAAAILWNASYDYTYTLLRFLADGQADTDFGQDGVASLGVEGTTEPGLATQDNGYLILASASDDFSGTSQPFLARYENATDDTDGDGVPDSEDAYPDDNTIATVAAVTGTGYFTIDVSGTPGAFLANVQALADDDASVDQTGKPTGEFKDGLVNFTILGLDTGATVTVDITCPTTPSMALPYKNDESGFSDFSSGSVLNGDTYTLTLTDGGDGDADTFANSEIADPFGPAWPGGGSSGGGGCAMAPAFGGNGALGWLLLLLGPALLVLHYRGRNKG